MNYRNPINHPSILFKKESILKAGSYESMLFFEDYYLWLKCKKKKYKFHNLDIPLLAMKRESLLLRRYGLLLLFLKLSFFIRVLRKIYYQFLVYSFSQQD